MNETVAAEDEASRTRHAAVEANNRAWRLAETPNRTEAESTEMLDCAHAAALHWGKIGTDVHKARASLLLGHVHALLGDGQSALHYARQAFDAVLGRESPPWEVAFAHAVLANAAAAAGLPELHAKHHRIASSLGGALADEEERQIFDKTFRVIPQPA
jgi:hypothetical protein